MRRKTDDIETDGFERSVDLERVWAGERAVKGSSPAYVDFSRRVYDERDPVRYWFPRTTKHATCPWPAIKDAAVRRPPLPPFAFPV